MRSQIVIKIPIPLWFRRLVYWLNSKRPSQWLVEMRCRCRVPQDAPYNTRLYTRQEISDAGGHLLCIRCGAEMNPFHATQ